VTTLFWTALLLAASSAVARADGVVLLEAEPVRPALCDALRIQLTDVAQVSCPTDRGATDLTSRIARASAAVRDLGAELGVLLERDPDARHLRMYLVSAQQDRAVLSVERIEDRSAPDIDRSLALKARDTLEVLRGARTSSTAQAAAPADVALAIAPQSSVSASLQHAAHGPQPGLSLLLETGGALSAGRQRRAAGLLALGARTTHALGYGELALSGHVASGVRETGPLGQVVEDEWGLALSLRAGRSLGRWSVGGLAELGAVRASALGITADGSGVGRRALGLARLGIGLDLRVTVLRGPAAVELRLAPCLQIDPVAQEFSLDGQRALALGRVRALVPLTLLITLPVHALRGADDV
jgi:hypothetical protein